MSIIPEVKAVKQLKQYYKMMEDAKASMQKGGRRRRSKTRKRRRKKTTTQNVGGAVTCPSPKELKKTVLERALVNIDKLDPEKFPFKLNKKQLETQINKLSNKDLVKSIVASENVCPTDSKPKYFIGGRRGQKGGNIVSWVVYILCISMSSEEEIMEATCYDDVWGPNPRYGIAPSPAAESPAAAAPAASAAETPNRLSNAQVDALSREEYDEYLRSLGGGRRRKIRKRRRKKTKRKRRRNKKTRRKKRR